MDGMTGDPPFTFWVSKGGLTGKAYAKFRGILIAGYILNEFKWIFNIRPLVALVLPDLVFNCIRLQVSDSLVNPFFIQDEAEDRNPKQTNLCLYINKVHVV